MDNSELLKNLTEIKNAFEANFENPLFLSLLEGLPIDPLLLKDIRDFFKLEETWAITEERTRDGIRNLELFIITLRHYLLPCIKERLRISQLRPDMMIRDRDQKAIRALVAYSIPIKVELLDEQIKTLKAFLDSSAGELEPSPLEKYSNVSA